MKYIHRFILFPITVTLRLTIMWPLLALMKAGEAAERGFDWFDKKLPGYRSIP